MDIHESKQIFGFMNKKILISIDKVSFIDIYTKTLLTDIHILDEH